MLAADAFGGETLPRDVGLFPGAVRFVDTKQRSNLKEEKKRQIKRETES